MDDGKKVFEEKFLIDYFRFAININLYGAAPYLELTKKQPAIMDSLTELAFKAVAINVHRLLHESYENLAQFLHALLYRKDKDVPLHEYLGNVDIKKSKSIPKKSKIENVDTFLSHHGLPINENEICSSILSGGFDAFKNEIQNRLIRLFKMIPESQDINSTIYNTTKHSKAWVSSAREFMNDIAAPATPMAIIIKDGSIQKKWVSISFDRKHIQAEIYIIQGITALMRDFLLAFAVKHYPDAAKQMLRFAEPRLLRDDFDQEGEIRVVEDNA